LSASRFARQIGRAKLPCAVCKQNQKRVERAEEAERLLLLFTKIFSRLSLQLAEIEAEYWRRYYEENPPPPGAEPVKRQRYLLVPINHSEDVILKEPKDP
jgi:hypothetical protein